MMQTARDINAIGCHACGLLVAKSYLRGKQQNQCPRCGAGLHSRKPQSLSRCWAYLIAAIILYIPANLFPIMTVISFGQGHPDTIISGIFNLYNSGQVPIALLVFVASILVPIVKILVLVYLLITVQRRITDNKRPRTVLYRLTEMIGRWSMIDVFMISILIALVQLDAVATIDAGPGAIAFAAVVILTMIAARHFDPRLIWDNAKKGQE